MLQQDSKKSEELKTDKKEPAIDLLAAKEVEVIDFNSQMQVNSIQVDELLGDLLFYLRQNKHMSTLMVCRQIERIEVHGDIAVLCSEKGDLSDLVNTDRHKLEIEKFFKQKGLGFKLEEKKREKSKAEMLREYFGDKLIIE